MIDTQSSLSWSEHPDFLLRTSSWSWFRAAATCSLGETAQRHGLMLQVNMTDLGTAFFRWQGILEFTNKYAGKNPVDYAYFSGGALLECLLSSAPLEAHLLGSVENAPLRFRTLLNWPSGFASTALALTHLDAYLRVLGQPCLRPDYELMAKHWNSLHENVSDALDSVGAFFDVFCGLQPNWNPPFSIDRRPGMSLRGRELPPAT